MSQIVSATYANHDNKAANVVYADGTTKYVVRHTRSRYKRDLVAWIRKGNVISPCPNPVGVTEYPPLEPLKSLIEYVDDLAEKIDDLTEQVEKLKSR